MSRAPLQGTSAALGFDRVQGTGTDVAPDSAEGVTNPDLNSALRQVHEAPRFKASPGGVMPGAAFRLQVGLPELGRFDLGGMATLKKYSAYGRRPCRRAPTRVEVEVAGVGRRPDRAARPGKGEEPDGRAWPSGAAFSLPSWRASSRGRAGDTEPHTSKRARGRPWLEAAGRVLPHRQTEATDGG